jgi:hypothetical protein
MTLSPEPLLNVVPTSARLLYKSRYLQLAIDAHKPWLYASWLGEINQAELREGVDIVVRVVQENGIAKLLNDNRHLTALHVSSEDWHGIEGLNRLHAAGLHYVAWVYAPNAQARRLANEAMEKNVWPLMLTFEEFDVAMDWLQDVA